MKENATLLELIAISIYRLSLSLENADEKFYSFQAGKDSRTPNEILKHLIDVANYGLSIAGAEKSESKGESQTETFINTYLKLKEHLKSNSLSESQLKQLVNGPLSDALTHIGQIAYLRRLFGEPISGGNYANAMTN